MFQELQVKVCILLWRSKNILAQVVDLIDLDDFDYLPAKIFLKVLLDFFKKYGTVPTRDFMIQQINDLPVQKEAKDKVLEVVMQDLSLEDTYSVLEVVESYCRKKKLVNVILSASEHLTKNELDAAERVLTSFSPVGESLFDATRLFTDRTKILKKLISGDESEVLYVPTLLIDEYIGGGLRIGTLSVLLGLPGKGKTAFSCYLAKVAALYKIPTLYITLEVEETEIAKRIYASLIRIPLPELPASWNVVESKLKNLGTICGEILVKQFPSVSVNVIKSYIRWIKESVLPVKFVIVDYGDLLLTEVETERRRFDLERIFAELRDIAVKEQVIMFTPSQANRQALTAEVIDMDHVAESFAKMMIADVVLTINQTHKERESSRARLFIAKNRYGIASVTRAIGVDFSTMHFWKLE